MINVLHLMNYINNGGAEKYIISLAEKLQGKKCRFYVGVSKRTNNIFENQLEELGVKIVILPIKSLYDLGAIIKIKRFCKANEIGIIHTHFLRENCVSTLSRLLGNKVKVINTCHMNWRNKKSVQLINRLITKLNYKIIAVSNSVKEILVEEGIKKDRIEIIYNGVDYDFYQEKEISSLNREFNLDKDIFKVVTIARFNGEKGHTYLLDIIEELQNKIDIEKFKFIFVGDGELKTNIENIAKNKGIDKHIIFTGVRRDIKNILYGSDLYISPSKNEALGLSILEAMACGVPIIATDVGGTSEILGKENEFLVNYGDTKKACNDIIEIFNNEGNIKEKVILNGKNRIKSIFNLETMSQKTYNLYEHYN